MFNEIGVARSQECRNWSHTMDGHCDSAATAFWNAPEARTHLYTAEIKSGVFN